MFCCPKSEKSLSHRDWSSSCRVRGRVHACGLKRVGEPGDTCVASKQTRPCQFFDDVTGACEAQMAHSPAQQSRVIVRQVSEHEPPSRGARATDGGRMLLHGRAFAVAVAVAALLSGVPVAVHGYVAATERQQSRALSFVRWQDHKVTCDATGRASVLAQMHVASPVRRAVIGTAHSHPRVDPPPRSWMWCMCTANSTVSHSCH
jgi:hypothetical protein